MRYLALVFLLCLGACKAVDIRPSKMEITSNNATKGRALLLQAEQAANTKSLLGVPAYEVVMNDQFFGMIGRSGNPWGGNKNVLRFQFKPNANQSKCIFLEGRKEGQTWYYNKGRCAYKKGDKPAKEGKEKDITFWLPTYHYFMELPAMIQQAELIYCAGDTVLNGTTHDKVFVTWKSLEANEEFDQYVLYVNQETKRIEAMQYTIREQFKFLKGWNFWSNFRNINGSWVPFTQTVSISGDQEKVLHRIEVKEFNLLAEAPADLETFPLD